MKSFIRAIVVFIFISLVFGSLVSGAINLSNTSNKCEYPYVLPHGNRVMVVWSQMPGGIWHLYYRVYSNNSWGPVRRIRATGYHCEYPNLALDAYSNNIIHLTYMYGTARANREIYYMRYNNGTWETPQRVFRSTWNSCWPRIGVQSNNAISIIWSHELYPYNNTKYDIWNTWKYSGGGWNSSGANVSRTPNTIAIHCDHYVRGTHRYACWMDGHETMWAIYFAQSTGSSWGSVIQVSAKDAGWWPGICADSKGNVHILYSTLRGAPYYVNRISGVWSTPRRVPGASGHIRDFCYIEVDNEDTLHGTWRQSLGGNNNIVYAAATSNGGWSNPTFVSNGINCRTPVCKPDNKGYVHIVWYDEGIDHGDIFYAKVEAGTGSGGGGGGPNPVAPIARFTHSPERGKPPLVVTFDASESEDPDGSIMNYSWDFGDGGTGNGQKVVHAFNRKGTYKVVLTVLDNSGLLASTDGYVYVSDPPKARFTMNPTTGVAPLVVKFDASSSYDPDGTIKKYYWDFGDGQRGAGKKIPHTFMDSGTYTITLEVVDDFGLNDTTAKSIKILRVHPPLNIRSEFKVNRNLFTREYLFEIKWDKNPLNEQYGVYVLNYRVYRKFKGTSAYSLIATLKNNTFVYLDRKLNEGDDSRYDYTVTAVDNIGNESVLASTDKKVELLQFNQKSTRINIIK